MFIMNISQNIWVIFHVEVSKWQCKQNILWFGFQRQDWYHMKACFLTLPNTSMLRGLFCCCELVLNIYLDQRDNQGECGGSRGAEWFTQTTATRTGITQWYTQGKWWTCVSKFIGFCYCRNFVFICTWDFVF